MCKYCDTNGEKSIMSYDNHNSMNIYCGQYQGVNVSSNLTMKGNMLILHASGSYRSHADCYYEDEGLDCDNENANNSREEYIKLSYCPFCGKKLTSTCFEKQALKDEIAKIKDKLKNAKEKLEHSSNLHISTMFIVKGGWNEYEEFKEKIWAEDKRGNTVFIPVPMEELMKCGNVKITLYYGAPDSYHHNYRKLDDSMGLTFGQSDYADGIGRFYGYYYDITEKQYDRLAEIGVITRNDNKLSAWKDKHKKIETRVKDYNTKLSNLREQLKLLK